MVDLILLAIILIAAIYGFRLGLMKSLIGLLGNILALFLGYILAKPASEYIQQQFQTIDTLAEYIKNVLPMPQDFSEMVASMDGLGKLYTYLENSPLPEGLQESILTNVQLQINEIGQGAFITMADTVAQTVAQALLQGLSFIGLWLFFCLVLTFFGKIFAGFIHSLPVIGLLDRLGGLAVTVFLVVLTISVLYSGICILGLGEESVLAESEILTFLSQKLMG